jgi:hypothetical protein
MTHETARGNLGGMKTGAAILAMFLSTAFGQDAKFNDKGELAFPADYREWVFLSSGLGMTYGPAAPGPLESPRFDTVFVSPAAFRQFKETGVWPEGTIFALEIRYSVTKGSINNGAFYQSDVAAIEAAVKDTKRFKGGWDYFGFGGGLNPVRKWAAPIGSNAGCIGCHSVNGAVENTFAQFYPTALAIAESKGTVKKSYKAPPPSPVALLHRVQAGQQSREAIEGVKKADPEAGVLKEPVMNQIGYALLQDGKKVQAIDVFLWVTETYPRSANAQDSLSEALEADGKAKEARLAAQRVLALLDADPALNEDAKVRLKKASQERVARLGGSQ